MTGEAGRAGRAAAEQARLWATVGVGLVLQLLFWGHWLPVVRVAAEGLGRLSRWMEPTVGLLLPRLLFLLPAAMVVVLAPSVLRRRRPSGVLLLLLATLVAAVDVVTVVVLTRGA